MITYEESKKYTKGFEITPSAQEVLDELEKQIKKGERHPRAYTTGIYRPYAEEIAKYCRSLGYTNARIKDIYNLRTGQRGGNYLQIDLDD